MTPPGGAGRISRKERIAREWAEEVFAAAPLTERPGRNERTTAQGATFRQAEREAGS